jgi:hypothetical protein
MPVYVLREGVSNVFKVGRTKGEVDGVVKRLRTGNSQPLNIFAVIETNKESACEAYFHRRLVSRRVVQGGGWEFFEMESEQDMRRTIEEFEDSARELEDIRHEVAQFRGLQCNDDLVDSTPEDRALLAKLLSIKEEQAYLQLEQERLESKLKLRIGAAAGIRGVATWKSEPRFDEQSFKERDPEAYYQVLERYACIDTTAWKENRPRDYESARNAYFSVSRRFLTQKSN